MPSRGDEEAVPEYADDLLYAPLPQQVVKQIEEKIKQITYQGKPLLAAAK